MVLATQLVIDRRVATRRQPLPGTVCRLVSGSGQNLGRGLVWNISSSGVGMLLSRRVAPGSTLRAELVSASATVSLPLTVRVAHVSKLPTGHFYLGGQFGSPLLSGQMQQFLK